MTQENDLLKKVVALCKRRGFVYPGSDIYGGFANTYSFGPNGTRLKNNLRNLWWTTFVRLREDVLPLDGPILLHPKAWVASGHVAGFNDALVDCKECKARLRADHLLEKTLHIEVEGLPLHEINRLIQDKEVPCPNCGAHNWTEARLFNLMFSTQLSKTNEESNIAYLRPETAQAIFLDFKNVVDTMRVSIPFGIAQIGKAFRNEITPGNFIFRVIEFEQMEIEFFIPPDDWKVWFERWLQDMFAWCDAIGLKREHLEIYEHPKEKLSHYSDRTVDILYDFPFGRSELYGLAYRTDFDLKQHSEHAKAKLEYLDPKTQNRFIPHVIEPTFGMDRTILAILCESYDEEVLEGGESRTVLRLPAHIAPIKVAIFPLMKRDGMPEKAREIYKTLASYFDVEYDDGGAIGRRYRRQDEIGTPFCITVDYDTLKDDTVTIRYRDSMKQDRLAIKDLVTTIMPLVTR